MHDTELRLEFESASSMVDPAEIGLRWLKGREALSEIYEYELELEVDVDGGLSDEVLEDLLRMPCRVRFGGDDERELHGILRSVTVCNTTQPRPVSYRAVMVPKLWITSQTRRSRVFQDLSVSGIVTAILTDLGLEEGTHFEWRTSREYPVSEYTVQYQESDLDLIHRLLEHHGIFYFFIQDPDTERLIFADDNRELTPIPDHETIPFTPGDGSTLAEGVTELTRHLTPQPAMVLLRDYNWRTPSVGLQAESAVDEKTGRGFVSLYGEHFKDPGAGDALATVRSQEMMSTRDVYEGRCRIVALAPGHRFELSSHPLMDLDKTYVVTEVEQTADARRGKEVGSLGYDKTFVAIPADVPFRPRRRTARPKIEGIMHARVDGELPGTAAPIDEFGRYKILFPFDLVGRPGGKASRWVRLAQPASGAGYGIHFPLHIGVEVAVSHIDGDPDRPIIMNSPPNAETRTPVSDANPTQSQIITQTGIRMTWDDDCPPE